MKSLTGGIHVTIDWISSIQNAVDHLGIKGLTF